MPFICVSSFFVVLLSSTLTARKPQPRHSYLLRGNHNAINNQTTDYRKYFHNSGSAVTNRKKPLRIYQGTSVGTHEYPYVVVLAVQIFYNSEDFVLIRYCTGSLISQKWVLTAAHCVNDPENVKKSWILYDNLTNIFSNSTTKSKALKGIPHHKYYLERATTVDNRNGFFWSRNDIGLLLVNKVEVKQLGKLSAEDYKSLIGYPVTYVGGGNTDSELKNETYNKTIAFEDQIRPLQMGEAVVSRCAVESALAASYICLRPKCSKRSQQTRAGDSGGPLLRRGKIIGVASFSASNTYIALYTAVSPYLDWLQHTMSSVKS